MLLWPCEIALQLRLSEDPVAFTALCCDVCLVTEAEFVSRCVLVGWWEWTSWLFGEVFSLWCIIKSSIVLFWGDVLLDNAVEPTGEEATLPKGWFDADEGLGVAEIGVITILEEWILSSSVISNKISI